MATAILLGVPPSYIGTLKSALTKERTLLGAWSVVFVPAPRKEIEISIGMIKRTHEIAAKSNEPHILGFSAQSNRHEVANAIKPYFRFRWFDHSLLRVLGSPKPAPFVQSLVSALAEESYWAELVMPSGLDSPLLLPECSFTPKRREAELWRHACAYGDRQNILGARKAINSFRSAHYRKVSYKTFSAQRWVDEQERVFDKDGPRHGVAPFPRDWKFSYRIELGFHFDVTSVDGKQFALTDASGKRHQVGAGDHLNIDPHGYVRL